VKKSRYSSLSRVSAASLLGSAGYDITVDNNDDCPGDIELFWLVESAICEKTLEAEIVTVRRYSAVVLPRCAQNCYIVLLKERKVSACGVAARRGLNKKQRGALDDDGTAGAGAGGGHER
jgi:hypothetical protein